MVWKDPHPTPHMAIPNARTGSEGAKKVAKTAKDIQTRKSMVVFRGPILSQSHPLATRPISWPTTDELESPDCHEGGMAKPPRPSSIPNRC